MNWPTLAYYWHQLSQFRNWSSCDFRIWQCMYFTFGALAKLFWWHILRLDRNIRMHVVVYVPLVRAADLATTSDGDGMSNSLQPTSRSLPRLPKWRHVWGWSKCAKDRSRVACFPQATAATSCKEGAATSFFSLFFCSCFACPDSAARLLRWIAGNFELILRKLSAARSLQPDLQLAD